MIRLRHEKTFFVTLGQSTINIVVKAMSDKVVDSVDCSVTLKLM